MTEKRKRHEAIVKCLIVYIFHEKVLSISTNVSRYVSCVIVYVLILLGEFDLISFVFKVILKAEIKRCSQGSAEQ